MMMRNEQAGGDTEGVRVRQLAKAAHHAFASVVLHVGFPTARARLALISPSTQKLRSL